MAVHSSEEELSNKVHCLEEQVPQLSRLQLFRKLQLALTSSEEHQLKVQVNRFSLDLKEISLGKLKRQLDKLEPLEDYLVLSNNNSQVSNLHCLANQLNNRRFHLQNLYLEVHNQLNRFLAEANNQQDYLDNNQLEPKQSQVWVLDWDSVGLEDHYLVEPKLLQDQLAVYLEDLNSALSSLNNNNPLYLEVVDS